MSDDPVLEAKRWRTVRLVVLGLAGSSLAAMNVLMVAAAWRWSQCGGELPKTLETLVVAMGTFFTIKAWDTLKELVKP